jgi:hypothetical protein
VGFDCSFTSSWIRFMGPTSSFLSRRDSAGTFYSKLGLLFGLVFYKTALNLLYLFFLG